MKYIIQNYDRRVFQNRFCDFKTGNLISPIETQNYTIVQVAESYYTNGFTIENHRQICDLELTFSYMNGLCCSINNNQEMVQKQGLHLAFHGESHMLKSKRGSRFQTLAINFKEGPCLPLLDAIKEKSREQRSFFVPEIFGALTEIVAEFMRAESPFLESNLDGLITCILVKLARHGAADPLDEISSYDSNISAMRKYIDTRFFELCSLEEMSYAFGYSYSHISKIFKKTYGITPSDYLIKKKTEYACSLIREGAKLEEIAVVLGYSTVFNFSRAFKKQLGLSPSAYRRQLTP